MGIKTTDKTPIAERYVERYVKLCKQSVGSKAQERYARAQQRMIEELSAAEQRERVLRDALEFHDKLMARLWQEVNFFSHALSAETLQMLNDAEGVSFAALAPAPAATGKEPQA